MSNVSKVNSGVVHRSHCYQNLVLKQKLVCLVKMASATAKLLLTISVAFVVSLYIDEKRNRTFTIDHQADIFLMDEQPFRYVSGSFHYFRALPQTWRTKLKTMRAAGLNAVDTYVEWSLHNPKDGEYKFEDIANVEEFIEIAQEEDLYVILRPGPYICAERDNGGHPFWLFRKFPDIKVRTSDLNYKQEVSKWYSVLMPRLIKYFYGNGGPIIMVQVENEYGAFSACDKNYLAWLRDETEKYVQQKAVLFTTDFPDESLFCGKISDVFATVDFGIDHEIKKIWETLRVVQPTGPLVNSEFYPGWLTHWQEENQRRDADKVSEILRQMLEAGASVNFYMFFGGTNFGFTAGANDWGYGNYTTDITSYDYDAIMDEAGDPTSKYIKVRDVVKEFISLPDLPVPNKALKMAPEPVLLRPLLSVLSDSGRKFLGVKTVTQGSPLTFEEFDQFSGIILYEADLPELKIDPSLLNGLHDRATVFIDRTFVGTLSRENAIYSLPISAGFGKKLQIIVENQGRINFNTVNDTKGILGFVTIQQSNGVQEKVLNWTSVSMPLDYSQLQAVVKDCIADFVSLNPRGLLLEGPVIFLGEFAILNKEIHDTYLDPTNWGKGVIFVNGFNLGRYWPLVGPQITLYLPKEILKQGKNEIILLEFQKAPSTGQLNFTVTPQLDFKKSKILISSQI